jgi:glycosyltransferase involved in cell wall biosynthesis
MKMSFDLSVIIPARNEQDNISATLDNLEKTLDMNHEVIVVNDYSVDRTRNVVEDLMKRYPNITIVDNMYSPGLVSAFKTGIEASKAEIIVFLMGDSCDSIFTVQDMYKKIKQGYDVVCGSRYMEGGARIGGSRLKAFFSWFVGRSMQIITKIPTHDISNNFKMYRKSAIESIDITAQSFEVSLEVLLKMYYKKYRIAEVPTVWKESRKGKSNFKMLNVAIPYLRWYLWAIITEVKRCFMH